MPIGSLPRFSTEPGTGRIDVGPKADSTEVPREDVAEVIAEVLARPRTAHATIGFTGGTTPITDAVAGFES